MTKSEKEERGRGSKLQRTEAITVRFDEKTRYLVELAARFQRRTTSSFIESAVAESLGGVTLVDRVDGTENTISDLALKLWDVYESDRFLYLAIHHPDLLTFEEQLCYKLISESEYNRPAEMTVQEQMLVGADIAELPISYEIDKVALRETFHIFKKIAAGTLDKSALPSAIK